MPALAGRRILVTGASSGIGRAIALRAAEEGASVLGVGRARVALESLAAGGNGAIATAQADLREHDAADYCVSEALARLGGLDGIAHAAGTVLRNEDLRQTSDDAMADLLDLNLLATLRLCRAGLRVMTPAGGAIVLVGSQLAHVGIAGYATYSAAKGGVTALARTLAVQHGPDSVRVNVVAPGVVRTAMAYVDRENFDELEAGIAERHPLRRIGQPGDIAAAVAFLLSDDASWITGHTLVVDGGYTAQ